MFEQVRLADGTVLSDAGTMVATVNGSAGSFSRLRSVRVESSDALSAVVTVEGEYSQSAVSGGAISATRRYVFTAGSPTAQIRHIVAWEGDSGYQGFVRMNRVRDTFSLGAPVSVVSVRAEASRAAVEGNPNGSDVVLSQNRRATNRAPRSYTLNFPGRSSSGVAADGAYIAARTSKGTLAVALRQMDRYEPAALRVLEDGTVAVDVLNEETVVGVRQGFFANYTVSALSGTVSTGDIERLTFAPANSELHAWPSSQWFAASSAVPEFPYGQIPSAYSAYNTIIPSVLQATIRETNNFGLYGVMTYGLYPRNWVNPIQSNEVAQGGGPTPETWDDLYWGTTWTDYHNSSKLGSVWAMQSGDTSWLDSITAPAAWRSLYTQAMQCSPTDTYFYCGQLPAGYGGFRTDFNSSHAYLDNVFLYSYLFGDESVVPRLARGANSMRGYLCPGRVDAERAVCGPTAPKADPYAVITGRVASQFANIFQYLGTSSRDGSYLDDWKSLIARAVTQYYVEATRGGQSYGFWAGTNNTTGNIAPGVLNDTDQTWMLSLYDMEVLYNYMNETNDTPIGSPALQPSRIITNWARTLVAFGGGTGSAEPSGTWPNALRFRYSGNRIGGTLEDVQGDMSGSDPVLYDAGKADLVAVLARAASWTGDSAITGLAQRMVQYVLPRIGASFPLGKEQGLMLARIPSAVARLSGLGGSLAPQPTPPPPAPTPSPTPNPTSPNPSPTPITPPPPPPPPAPTPTPTPNPNPNPSPASDGLPESTYSLQGGEAVNLQDGFPFAPTYNFAWFFEHSLGQGTCNGTDFVTYDLYVMPPGGSSFTRIGGHTGAGNSSFTAGYSMTTDGCAKGRFLYNMPSSNPSGTYRVGLCITNTQNQSQRYCTSISVTKP